MAEKSERAKKEEEILKFWQDKKIFKRSLAKPAPQGEFVFYEGPPTANGRPGIHHLEARAFKDAIPRYKTMRGYHVRRKGGWDTHGLPVELQVEKELGLKSKKEVEQYGVAAFNEKCKESVWQYVTEWEGFTNRIGYWVDLENPYVTYKTEYIESLWQIVKKIDEKGLLYKDYKVVPWCPRCGTALSSHELAQGYQEVKELAVTAKFELVDEPGTFLLAWTTTPWTLPGNVALAVNPKIDYVQIKVGADSVILAEARLGTVAQPYVIEKKLTGRALVGLAYKPLYSFLLDNLSGAEKEKLPNAYKVYAADFVTTEDGTGIVHTAVMYGQDDFELGTKVGLPKYHLVNEDGAFKEVTGFLAGKFVKDEAVAVEIIKDLAGRQRLFAKEKYEHSYPFCWRCKTPLIYFARDSWYIKMSALREELVKENQAINWEPAHIKDGRFGEWLREIKDWAVSRERYWGTPLPVWLCEGCGERQVIGSVAELAAGQTPRNQYWVMRHGEAESNAKGVVSSAVPGEYRLTARGQAEVAAAAEQLSGSGIDLIVASPVLRTRETAEIVAKKLGLKAEQIVYDERLREIGFGALEGDSVAHYHALFPEVEDRLDSAASGVEPWRAVRTRALAALYEIESKHDGQRILVVTHQAVGSLLLSSAPEIWLNTGEFQPLRFAPLPHNARFELDLHRPHLDEVTFSCTCGGVKRRVKEVMDVWFDSGAMPFAQDHYPFAAPNQALLYPADFIAEAIDQTRGWFYTLHAIGSLLGRGRAYRNVICLGHILDAAGKKMSKSVGNIVDPWQMIDRYGADALRFWMYAVNQPGDSKNFDEKTVDEVVKKVLNLFSNVAVFYATYADREVSAAADSANVLDRWIVSRLHQLVGEVTVQLDHYHLLEPARSLRDFIGDLSQWYLRRSRERFKSELAAERREATATLRYVLRELSKLAAPFMPFVSEEVFQLVRDRSEAESVHLADWPVGGTVEEVVLATMAQLRSVVSAGLEQRAKAGIKVRQPLASLRTNQPFDPAYLAVIRDELNVLSVAIDSAQTELAVLDLLLTPELEEQGQLRELVRELQDWRKAQGLAPQTWAVVAVPAAKRELAKKYEAELKQSVRASEFVFSD